MVIGRLPDRPTFPQGLPADQPAPEREKRLVDVGPPVVPHAEAAELIQPGKRALDDPPPSLQATPVLRAAHGQQRENVAGSQTETDDLRVIRAVAEHAVRTAPRSPSLALERRNRIDERQRFFRVMPVGPSQPDGDGMPRPSQIT